MKSLFGIVLAVGLLPAAMADAADMKIGYVDVKSAFENTKAYQKGLNRLKELATSKQKELNALQSKIEQSEKDLLGQTMAMSPERLAQKQSEIKELRKLYSRRQQDAQDEIVSEQSKLQAAQGLKFQNALTEFGKSAGYDLIFSKAQLLYASPARDVTAEITKLLDK
ncbi:MAG: OmpH family outer membrane protein [Mariprofundaceae bacterium]|nr:OmpH family outer membrane protein [Mariprofundaceae bacterium]